MNIKLYEIGVVATILLTAGVAVRGSSQVDGKSKQQQETCVGHLGMLAKSFYIYKGDYDDTCPLSMALAATGSWSVKPLTKSGWDNPNNIGWANSMYPYVQSQTDYICPSAQRQGEIDQIQHERRIESSYTYNGLMHALEFKNVATPADLPIFWEGLGAAYLSGHYASNPLLLCHDSAPQCVYAGAQGPVGVMYRPLGSMWVHGNGSVFAYADGHVEWRSATISDEKDGQRPPWLTNPFAGYDEDGNPISYWNEGLHPILFKPDSKFSDKQTAQPKQLATVPN